MKRITNFSFTVDNNLNEWYDKYNLKTYLASPYQTHRMEIQYDDGTEEITETIVDRTIVEELKKE